MKRLAGAVELLDGPLDPGALEGNLRDLERFNRWLGGATLSWRALEHALRDVAPDQPVRLLDVGTGRADIPLELVRRARRAGRQLEVVASDVRPEIVVAARRRVGAEPSVKVVLAERAELNSAEGARRDLAADLRQSGPPWDVVHASLLVHHLDPPALGQLLQEMAGAASRAVIVNDLYRRWHAWLAARLLARVALRNPYTRHDAPLSVRRAYQPAEIARLARPAGLRPSALVREPLGHRYALVLERRRP